MFQNIVIFLNFSGSTLFRAFKVKGELEFINSLFYRTHFLITYFIE